MPVCPHFLMELHVPVLAVPNSRWLEYIPQLDMVTSARWRSRTAAPSSEAPPGIAWTWPRSSGTSSIARSTTDPARRPTNDVWKQNQREWRGFNE